MTTIVFEPTMMPMSTTGMSRIHGPPLVAAKSPMSTTPHQRARIMPRRARAFERVVFGSETRSAMSAGAEIAELCVPLAGDDGSDEGGAEIPGGEEADGVDGPVDLEVELRAPEAGH